MADIPERREIEQELEAVLLPIFNRYARRMEEWVATVVESASTSSDSDEQEIDIPAREVERFREDVAENLEPFLAGIFADGAARMAQETGVDETLQDEQSISDEEAALLIALLFARRRAKEVSDALADRLELKLRELANSAKVLVTAADRIGGETARMAKEKFQEQAAASIDSVVGEKRPSIIAATETTNANSAGELSMKEVIENEIGESPEAFWMTANDDKVCPVCGPMDMQPEDNWPPELSGGPPAHPNCRCFIKWVLPVVV